MVKYRVWDQLLSLFRYFYRQLNMKPVKGIQGNTAQKSLFPPFENN
jgi:hypothetical protein